MKSKVLMNPVDTLPSSQLACKICGAASRLFDEAIVLRKHTARYFRCVECGFLQTEEPHWIDEAYSSAIAGQDVGIMARNLTNGHVASAVLNLLFPKVSEAVDFGAGHGIFVRIMRDRGFNFFWSDRYATNDYARGFEAPAGKRFDFLTAFEVLEHLPDPISDVSRLMELSDNVFVSTALVPSPHQGSMSGGITCLVAGSISPSTRRNRFKAWPLVFTGTCFHSTPITSSPPSRIAVSSTNSPYDLGRLAF